MAAGARTDARPDVLGSTVLIASAGLVAGLLATAIVLTGDRQNVAFVALALPTGWAFIGSGLLVRRREPGNLVGTLMIAVGFAWFLAALGESDWPPLFTVGLMTGTVVYPILVHLVTIYPEGRFHSRFERRLVVLGYVSVLVGAPVSSLFISWPNDRCPQCPESEILVADRPGLGNAIFVFGLLLSLTALVSAVVALVRRWRSAGARARRALAPVLAAGALTLAATIGLVLAALFAGDLDEYVFPVVAAVFVTVPAAFLFGFVRSRLATAAVVSLLAELSQSPTAEQTEAAIGRALGDPSLRLAYWLPRASSYVDVEGRRLELPADSDVRATTHVEQQGEPVAALLHDASLLREPELVDAVASAALLVLQKDRLQAELRAKVEELRASRARIVEAGDAERRRLERNLHDGAQQRLVSLALALRLAEREIRSKPDAAAATLRSAGDELAHAVAELRELARGLHPTVVVDRGLPAAIEGLAARMPVAVESKVELPERPSAGCEVAAYYVVAEALANVVKYAQASTAQVDVRRDHGDVVVSVADDGVGGAQASPGSGLGGLADRVEALGGSLDLDSPTRGGTTLRARIPASADEG